MNPEAFYCTGRVEAANALRLRDLLSVRCVGVGYVYVHGLCSHWCVGLFAQVSKYYY